VTRKKKKHTLRPRGEQIKTSKLNKESVRRIRKMWDTGDYSVGFIAREYGVSVTTIRNVVLNITWKDK